MQATLLWSIGTPLCAGAVLLTMTSVVHVAPATTGPAVSFAIGAAAPPQLQSSEVEARRQAILREREGVDDSDSEGDGTGAARGGIALEWAEAPTSQADVIRDNGFMTLKVLNLDGRPQTLQATVIGDAGTMQSRVRSQTLSSTLPVGALQPLVVETMTTPSEPWSFSGAVVVHVRACPADTPGASRCHIAVSDPLFFNPVGLGPRMQFYGEGALASAHGFGDLRTGAGGTTKPQPAGTTRVMGGGPLHVDPAIDGAVSGETPSQREGR